jgi:CDP-diacylglycerol---serine O-phosphatidyltransferase
MDMLIRAKLMKVTKLKKQQYKHIPCIFTFLNALFGFLAILKALDGDTVRAALLLIVAACMDAFDGRLARVLHSTSYFGMELDSLCDALSFCVAPAVVVYCCLDDYTLGLAGKVILGFYVCAGLARLAKFNVTSATSDQKDYFVGLPTTLAAFFISQLLIYQSWLETHVSALLFHKNCVLVVMTCLALLMISSIKFYSFKNIQVDTVQKHPIITSLLFGCSIIGIMLMMKGYPVLLLVVGGYILTLTALHSVYRIASR